MSPNDNKKIQVGEVLGKFIAGMVLAELKNSKELQEEIHKAKKWIGEENIKSFVEATHDEHYAFVCACVDQSVLGKLSNETKDLFSKLEKTSCVVVEFLLLYVTGKTVNEKSNGRWLPALWKFKQMCEKYIEISPTNVKDEDLANAVKEILKGMIVPFRENLVKFI